MLHSVLISCGRLKAGTKNVRMSGHTGGPYVRAGHPPMASIVHHVSSVMSASVSCQQLIGFIQRFFIIFFVKYLVQSPSRYVPQPVRRQD